MNNDQKMAIYTWKKFGGEMLGPKIDIMGPKIETLGPKIETLGPKIKIISPMEAIIRYNDNDL